MPVNRPQYSRLLLIDREIRAMKYPNCTIIAREHEVTPRTISRDIEYMKLMLDAPIEYDTARRGYYYSEPGFHLPSIEIRESEFFTICIAQKALEQYQGTPIYEKLSSVFKKIQSLLPDTIRVNTSWIDTHYTFLRESGVPVDPAIWESVALSLRDSREIKILYHVPGGKPSTRSVRPYHIANYRGQWYLVGYCCMRKEIRTFAVSRIKKAEPTETRYDIPGDFDFNEYMGSHFGIIRDTKEYRVRVRFFPDVAPYIRERVWHESQNITEEKNGGLVLTFMTNSLKEVRSWVLSYGASAVVLKPEMLTKEIKRELRMSLGNYTP